MEYWEVVVCFIVGSSLGMFAIIAHDFYRGIKGHDDDTFNEKYE